MGFGKQILHSKSKSLNKKQHISLWFVLELFEPYELFWVSEFVNHNLNTTDVSGLVDDGIVDSSWINIQKGPDRFQEFRVRWMVSETHELNIEVENSNENTNRIYPIQNHCQASPN